MTENEFNSYISKIAKTIIVPQCSFEYVPPKKLGYIKPHVESLKTFEEQCLVVDRFVTKYKAKEKKIEERNLQNSSL